MPEEKPLNISLEVIRPLLPDTEKGRILREWDYTYKSESVGATLFEAVYESIVWMVFGKYGIGEETVRHLMENTGVFVNFYGYFDEVLLNEESPWFAEVDREAQFKHAIELGLQTDPIPYGESRTVDFKNIFFRGRLPGFLGFDENRLRFAGSRATIQQHQSFHLLGTAVTVGPSYRMIVEIDREGMRTNLPGGPSGSRFSPWYKTDLSNWLEGNYKKLQ